MTDEGLLAFASSGPAPSVRREQGIRDARYGKPRLSGDPDYRRGYEQGLTLRRPAEEVAEQKAESDEDKRAQLAVALERLHRPILAHQFPRLASKLHGLEMTFSQLVAISVVGTEGARTISQIADTVDLSHNATSRLVERLVVAGLLRRSEDPIDRRQKKVELTEKGAEFMPDVRATSLEAYADVLGEVPEEDVAQLLAILGRIERYLPKPPA